MVPVGRKRKSGQELSVKERLELFDKATERQRRHEAMVDKETVTSSQSDADRGWTREDIYIRDLSKVPGHLPLAGFEVTPNGRF